MSSAGRAREQGGEQDADREPAGERDQRRFLDPVAGNRRGLGRFFARTVIGVDGGRARSVIDVAGAVAERGVCQRRCENGLCD